MATYFLKNKKLDRKIRFMVAISIDNKYMKCFKCKQDIPDELFKKIYKDGVIATYNTCLPCRARYIEEKKASHLGKDKKEE